MKPDASGSVVCFKTKRFTEKLVGYAAIRHEKRLTKGSELVY